MSVGLLPGLSVYPKELVADSGRSHHTEIGDEEGDELRGGKVNGRFDPLWGDWGGGGIGLARGGMGMIERRNS
jgi:hypothetical protein